MNMTEMAETAARGAYAKNSWWRSVYPLDDTAGECKEINGVVCRRVEWSELAPEDREELIQTAYYSLLALVEAGWVLVAPDTPHVPRATVPR